VLRKKAFPRRLLVQVLRVGPSALVGLPFEITTESGRRIARAVDEAVSGRGVERVVVCSLVNDFWGYVATEEEYGRQFYEGGHTLYGPNTQRFLAAQAAAVAAETVGSGLFADVEDRAWNLKVRRYLPSAPGGAAPERRFSSKAAFSDPTATEDARWEQTWVDVAPGGLRWHEPLVRVEQSDDDGETWVPAAPGGRAADDQGWALEVTHLGTPDGGHHTYRVRWHDPAHRFGRRHRFVLLANGDRPEVAGAPFD
jgi:neutral ceramidase